MLDKSDVSQFETDGYVSPVSVLNDEEVAVLRTKLETVEAGQDGALYPTQRSKSFCFSSG